MGMSLKNLHGTVSSGSVDVITAPSSGYTRQNLFTTIKNMDATGTISATFNLIDGATTRSLVTVSLGPGQTAKFADHLVLDSTSKKLTISITGTISTAADWQTSFMELG